MQITACLQFDCPVENPTAGPPTGTRLQHLCVLIKDLLQYVVWSLQQVSEMGFPMSNTRAGNAMEQELGDQLGRLLGAIKDEHTL